MIAKLMKSFCAYCDVLFQKVALLVGPPISRFHSTAANSTARTHVDWQLWFATYDCTVLIDQFPCGGVKKIEAEMLNRLRPAAVVLTELA